MKKLFFLLIGIVFFACGNNNRNPEKRAAEIAASEGESEYKPVVDVTQKQLEGIWEITEIRQDPQVKGRKPTADEAPIMIGFTDDGKISTMPNNFDNLSNMLSIETNITVKNGLIFPSRKYMKFEAQLGDALEVLLINEKELVLRAKGWGSVTSQIKNKGFWYLQKTE